MIDWGRITTEDCETAKQIIGSFDREPDLVIAPDGEPYLYRWFAIPRMKKVNTYFHIQVASDPERPLHDHPWDNFSIILSGGYIERLNYCEGGYNPHSTKTIERRKGDTIYRRAHWAHRLILPKAIDYSMTLFSTGPKIRDWGFWYSSTDWRRWDIVTKTTGNFSEHIK